MGHTTQSAPLGLPSSAYVALYTYDITNHVIWLGAYIGETNSNALYSYNVLTQTLSDPVPVVRQPFSKFRHKAYPRRRPSIS